MAEGFTVTVATPEQTSDAIVGQQALVVISESVPSAQLVGRAPNWMVPIICMEPALFDDLGMTGPQWQRDFGDVVEGRRLTLASIDHPLTGGLPAGSVDVLTASDKLVWGAPAPTAIKIASIAGRADAQAIFAYDAGARLVSGRAPARRVGWFAGRDAATKLSANGWRLFEAAVRWAARPVVLIVVGQIPLNLSDGILAGYTERRFAVDVEIKRASAVTGDDFVGRRLAIVSESTSSADVQGKLGGVQIPLLVFEPALWDDLGMTGSAWQRDFGDAAAETDLVIVAPTHPLAAGLSGQARVTGDGPEKFVWGAPPSTAVRVATLAGRPGAAAIFAYERGAAMARGKANARRVGWFAGRDAIAPLNQNGFQLLGAAISWTAQLPFPDEGCTGLGQPGCSDKPLVTLPRPIPSTLIPGYDPAPHYSCEPPLEVGPTRQDGDGRPYYDVVSLATAPAACRSPALFCDSDDRPIGPPTAEQLNGVPANAVPCPPLAGRTLLDCGIDPASIGGDCRSNAECPAGQICAVVCADATCAGTSQRCGTPWPSCAGLPSEDGPCDPTELRLCPDPRAVGEVTPEGLAEQLSQALTVPESAKVPETEKPEVTAFEELVKPFCAKTPAQEDLEARQDHAKDSEQGNDQWGFFLAPALGGYMKLGLKELKNETWEIGARAGIKVGGKVMGDKVTALEATVDVNIFTCSDEIGVTLKLFGDAVAVLDTVDGGQLGLGKLKPTGSGVGTDANDKATCNTKFRDRNNKAGDLRKAMLFGRGVREHYLEKGVSKNLCQRTNEQLRTTFDCDAPDLIKNVNIPNAWLSEYEGAAEEFKDSTFELDEWKKATQASGELKFFDFRKPYKLFGKQVNIAIGPVPVVLAVEFYGTWGFKGTAQYVLHHGESLPQLGASLLAPMYDFMNDPADIRAAAGPLITPHAAMNVALFAGVGVPAVSLGIEGAMTIASVSAPLDALYAATRLAEPDPRDLQPSDYAGAPILGLEPKVSSWRHGFALGSHLDLKALNGTIDAALPVRFLFVSKTFRKRIAKWKGYEKSFQLVGIDKNDPLKMIEGLGKFVDKVAYTHVDRLDGSEVIARPDPTAFYPDVLGRETCSVPIP